MKPAFLDQPEAWTRATRDSRSIARQSTAFFGPSKKPRLLWSRVLGVGGGVLAAVLMGAIAVGGL
jgi:hypothetical protein